MGRPGNIRLLAWLLSIVLPNLATPLATAQDREVQRTPSIHFAVRDYAGVPKGILDRAVTDVSNIFGDMSIAVTSSMESLETDVDTSNRAELSNAVQIRIHILGKSFLMKNADAMGVAQERGLIAYVFYDRIQEFVRDFETQPRMQGSIGAMLGCMIA